MNVASAIIVLIFVVVTIYNIVRLYRQVASRTFLLRKNLNILKDEMQTKESIFRELQDINLGLTSPEEVKSLQTEVQQLQNSVKAEQGRISITQAELDAVETRLRELQEVERELESSQITALKEIEMLQSQERHLAEENQILHGKVSANFDRLEIILGQLHSSQEAMDSLAQAKTTVSKSMQEIEWYTEDIAKLNKKYVELKNAYDALDIEYAQLYEKHNAMIQAEAGKKD